MNRQKYDTDLTDAEWSLFEKTIDEIRTTKRGRKPGIPRREVVNGILYRLRTGCQWRNLPHDFPAWGTVYRTYRSWIVNGHREKIHDSLCREVRKKNSREAEPSALIIDSQSVKADSWAENTGYDMTRGRRSRESSVMSSSMFSVCLLASSSIQRRATEPNCSCSA